MTPCIFLKKTRVQRRHELYQIGLTKVFKSRLQKKFRILCGTFRKNPPNIAILPVKSPFPETTWFLFCPIFGTQGSCAPIKSILNSYSSSQKVELETCKLHFWVKIFPLHFLPRNLQFTREHSLTWFLFCPWRGASKSVRRNFLYGVWWKKNNEIDKYVECTAVFGTRVVCASARVWSLSGGLLPSLHMRQSIVLRVWF